MIDDFERCHWEPNGDRCGEKRVKGLALCARHGLSTSGQILDQAFKMTVEWAKNEQATRVLRMLEGLPSPK